MADAGKDRDGDSVSRSEIVEHIRAVGDIYPNDHIAHVLMHTLAKGIETGELQKAAVRGGL